MAGTPEGKSLWTRARKLRWHYVMRGIALFVLLDQLSGTWLTAAPKDTAIIVASLGALFAPLPKEKDKS